MSIVISNLSKSFSKKMILNEVSLTIAPKEMLCLLGSSGAGKTTLIRSIIGAIKINYGKILIDDIKVPNLELMRNIGYMPQEEALYSDITALENLHFFGGLYNLKGSKLSKRCEELLIMMDLFKDRNKFVNAYSGGMKKRLSLAIALLHNPKYIILDEPTVGLDPVLRKSIWDQFEKLKEEGYCLIVSTHVMDEALKCERLALIYDGKIIYDDTTKSLLAKTENGSIEELFFMAKEGK